MTRVHQYGKTGLVAFVKVMNEINEDYTRNKAKWTAESPSIQAVAKRVGSAPKDTVADLDGATYPGAQEQVSDTWMNGGAAKSMKSTADFLKSAGRITAASDSYAKYVNAEFVKAAAAK